MKRLRPLAGRVILNINLDDAAPSDGFSPQEIFAFVISRYEFTGSIGASDEEGGSRVSASGIGTVGSTHASGQPVAVAEGTARFFDREVRIQQMIIAPDLSGIALEVQTTEDGDAVLDDIIALLEEHFGFRDISAASRRIYGSSVTLEFDKDIDDYMSVFKRIQDLLALVYTANFQTRAEIRVQRIAFACDPSELPSAKAGYMGPFVIERRAGHPYSENRYFSSAPIRTSEHLDVLGKIEELMLESE